MTGRPDYDAGDLVVCVETSAPENYGRGLGRGGRHLQRDRVYRVIKILPHSRAMYGFVACLEGVRSGDETGGFDASRFRRIDPKPPEFWTGTIDADTPEQVPA